MSRFISRNRLRSSAFERTDDINQVNPKRMIFLSVEGDDTERNYFQHLNEKLDKAIIQIEVLRHKKGDGYSDPNYVIELLDEYVNVRNGEILPPGLTAEFVEKYSVDVLRAYLNDKATIAAKMQKQISEDLLALGIDIEYRRHLQKHSDDTDYFAVILDRDCGSHSRELMTACYNRCKEENYGFFISNPCFEFWLLLHLCDMATEFSQQELELLYANTKVSGKHTKISLEVSDRAHHNKKITSRVFEEYYYPNITKAIKQSEGFAHDFPDLFDKLGTNLSDLLKELGYGK